MECSQIQEWELSGWEDAAPGDRQKQMFNKLWLMDCRAMAERRPELGEHQSSTPFPLDTISSPCLDVVGC